MTTVPDNTAPKALAPIPPVYMDQLKALLEKVGTNPATLEFPTDKWGFTGRIRREVLLAASQVHGQDDKHDLLIGTLAVLMKHIKVRKDSDAALRAKKFAEAEAARDERIKRDRLTAPAVPTP